MKKTFNITGLTQAEMQLVCVALQTMDIRLLTSENKGLAEKVLKAATEGMGETPDPVVH